MLWWGLLAYLLIAPILPLTPLPISWAGITLMDWQRLLECGFLFFCVLWSLCFMPRSNFSIRLNYQWMAFFLLGLVSAIFVADHLTFALLDWSWMLLSIVVITLLRLWQMDRSLLDKHILFVVLLGSLIYLCWFWRLNTSVYFEPLPEGIIRQVVFPGFSNVRFFSDYQSFILLLLPTAVYTLVPAGPTRNLMMAIGGLYFSLALITGSRSLIAAHFILHVFMLVFLGKHYLPFLKNQLKFWFYGLLFFILLVYVMPLILQSSDSNLTYNSLARADSNGRSVLWKSSLDLVADHPILGVGPMHFANYPNKIAASTHNIPLQMAVEWGIPAAILFCWLAIVDIRKHFERIQEKFRSPHHEVSLELEITCATFAIVLQSMVACGPIGYPTGQVIAIICFGYLATTKTKQLSMRLISRSLIFIAICYIALIVVSLTMPTLQSIAYRNQCFRNDPWPTVNYFAPHFLQQGWLFAPCGDAESAIKSIQKFLTGRDLGPF